MRRGKLLGLAVLAVLAFGTALVSSASGFLLENLPEKANRAITGKAVGSTSLINVLGSETVVTCTGATSTGTEVS